MTLGWRRWWRISWEEVSQNHQLSYFRFRRGHTSCRRNKGGIARGFVSKRIATLLELLTVHGFNLSNPPGMHLNRCKRESSMDTFKKVLDVCCSCQFVSSPYCFSAFWSLHPPKTNAEPKNLVFDLIFFTLSRYREACSGCVSFVFWALSLIHRDQPPNHFLKAQISSSLVMFQTFTFFCFSLGVFFFGSLDPLGIHGKWSIRSLSSMTSGKIPGFKKNWRKKFRRGSAGFWEKRVCKGWFCKRLL